MVRAWRPDEIRAGAALALVLFAASQWAPGSEDALPACPRPTAVSVTERGHATIVRCGSGGPGASGALRGPARVLFELGIDPNDADAVTLEALPGVGPARAAAIVAGRVEGPYRTPSDLLRVRGVGAVTLARMREWLVFPDVRRSPARAGSLRGAPREPSS